MKFRAIALVAVIFGLALPSSTAGAKTKDYLLSTSIKQSKKQGYFRKRVEVQPASFKYDGYNVVISECWLEEEPDKKMYLVFTFKIDGRATKEHEIAHHKDIFLKFVSPKDVPEVQDINYFRFLPLSSVPRLVTGAYGQYVHFVEFKSLVLPKNLHLQLTIWGVESKEKKTDTYLDFKLE